MPKKIRNLVIVLGDQLNRDSAAFDDFDKKRDAIWMAEVDSETTHVWCHKLRIAFFLSAMRHFRKEMRERDYEVIYSELQQRPSDDRGNDHGEILKKYINKHRPEKLLVTHPGDYRVLEILKNAAKEAEMDLDVLEDRHFLCELDEFEEWADGYKELLLENFYRRMRRKHDILIGGSGKPEGGKWNFDKENRETFKKEGPGKIKAPRRFQTDDITDEVIKLVEHRFGDHPGSLEHFDLPVTHEQARAHLRDFIEHRLPNFGTYEDAMWTGELYLYHSRLTPILNTKLISPRDCIEAAIEAYEADEAPINSIEGFVRQILGWREFIRGIYWREMPKYAERNALRCSQDRGVPQSFWDGETEMTCIREAMRSVIDHGYAHHIQRLMVLGLFVQLYGTHPLKFHEWHMAMYLDAVDWVSLPNALGMSQYGDGGIVGTKPYCASGNYINKMSNYCKNCRYNYKEATGENACPVTTFYWDFLDRHQAQLGDNHRMGYQFNNLERRRKKDLDEVLAKAEEYRRRLDDGEGL